MKRDAIKTKKKILETAEKLFSLNGFDGTSVDSIAKKAEVNKATIYYHFENKAALIQALFKNILVELNEYMSSVNSNNDNKEIRGTSQNQMEKKQDKLLRNELEFLQKKKQIFALLLMESMKKKDDASNLFNIIKDVIEFENNSSRNKEEKNDFFLFEFFTGIMPMISFVIYQEKWSKFFNINEDEMMSIFLKNYKKTHLDNHL